MLDVLRDARVTTFCAPPTVWRMLIQQDLSKWSTSLRELVSAGEPLNPEVIEVIERAWGLTIRDGFGQTETTVQIGNSPGQPVKAGSMGRPLPGYEIVLVDPVSGEAAKDGEICVQCEPQRPVGLMVGYRSEHGLDDERNNRAFADGRYHTGDVASRDADGYITYVGRSDDVFKASDELRLAVPKAYVTLVEGQVASRELARDILRYSSEHLAPYKRVRRLEFAELPKTISGKIRRVDLRTREVDRAGERPEGEYREEDFA
jgi:acetyl-CoA synthetase